LCRLQYVRVLGLCVQLQVRARSRAAARRVRALRRERRDVEKVRVRRCGGAGMQGCRET
jgi:hypothetical protein